jgi:two-component system KDP operon response regulator KdpE
VSIIMLTVRDSEADKVAALDAGADDYVTKPFNMPELLARIRAALRRTPSVQSAAASHLRLGDVEIDFDARRIRARGRDARLTPKELEVLRYLAAHANKTVTHRELLQAVWGPDYGDEVDYLRVMMNQLRKKIEAQPSKPVYLLTEPWVGYRLQEDPDE